AAVLLAAAVTALVWANADVASYDSFWSTKLSIDLGGQGVSLDLRGWVNSGLMTLFFFVAGLEARREFDLGELRERRRFTLPLLAAVGGMAAAIAIYSAFNAGRPSAHGWGAAMSTDTAFALGLLALVGPRFADRTVAAALPSLDELRDRAALRARKRRHRHRQGHARPGIPLADHARDPRRLRHRQTRGDLLVHLACRAAERGTPAPSGRMGGGRGRRHHRRGRLHRLATGRNPCVRRAPARGGEGGHLERRARRGRDHVARLPRDCAAASARTDSGAARDRRAAGRPLHRRRSGA